MEVAAPRENKVLILRLSALGDIVLAASSLEYLSPRTQVDWVVGQANADLLKSHPRIHKLWVFDRKAGLWGWFKLGRTLYDQNYTAVYDLHSNLRSTLLRLQFKILDRMSGRHRTIRALKKERWKLWGYFAFKRWWPRRFRPRHLLARTGEVMVGHTPAFPKIPNFRHLSLPLKSLVKGDYFVVMPSSKWRGKEWPAERFRDLIEMMPIIPVILGKTGDRNSLKLVELLKNADQKFESGIDRWNLNEISEVIAGAQCVVSVDTGFAHLAQAMGVPTLVVFGPTVPDMGFGPWAANALALGKDLNCRPCGKDGRICQRVLQPYHCLRSLSALEAATSLKKLLPKLVSGNLLTSRAEP